VYGAHTLRICLTDSLGTKKVTIGVFYACELHGEDVILGRPWRKDQGIIVDDSLKQWRYPMGTYDIQVMAFRHYHHLRDRGTLQNPVRISVVSVTDPS
jgi:hypothetical protein